MYFSTSRFLQKLQLPMNMLLCNPVLLVQLVAQQLVLKIISLQRKKPGNEDGKDVKNLGKKSY